MKKQAEKFETELKEASQAQEQAEEQARLNKNSLDEWKRLIGKDLKAELPKIVQEKVQLQADNQKLQADKVKLEKVQVDLKKEVEDLKKNGGGAGGAASEELKQCRDDLAGVKQQLAAALKGNVGPAFTAEQEVHKQCNRNLATSQATVTRVEGERDTALGRLTNAGSPFPDMNADEKSGAYALRLVGIRAGDLNSAHTAAVGIVQGQLNTARTLAQDRLDLLSDQVALDAGQLARGAGETAGQYALRLVNARNVIIAARDQTILDRDADIVCMDGEIDDLTLEIQTRLVNKHGLALAGPQTAAQYAADEVRDALAIQAGQLRDAQVSAATANEKNAKLHSFRQQDHAFKITFAHMVRDWWQREQEEFDYDTDRDDLEKFGNSLLARIPQEVDTLDDEFTIPLEYIVDRTEGIDRVNQVTLRHVRDFLGKWGTFWEVDFFGDGHEDWTALAGDLDEDDVIVANGAHHGATHASITSRKIVTIADIAAITTEGDAAAVTPAHVKAYAKTTWESQAWDVASMTTVGHVNIPLGDEIPHDTAIRTVHATAHHLHFSSTKNDWIVYYQNLFKFLSLCKNVFIFAKMYSFYYIHCSMNQMIHHRIQNV